MRTGKLFLPLAFAVGVLGLSGLAFAGEPTIEHVINVQKYNRSIHVMAMLLVGFGFLMVFVRHYGQSALTATYILVSTAVPIYFLINAQGWIGEPREIEIDRFLLAEFAAASLLICAGAPLGRLKMPQYFILGLLFTPCYMINEWILVDHGFGLIPKGGFMDTGGSILIHAFGALFGLGVVMTMTTKEEFAAKIEANTTSNLFSLLGSMVLWLFWPSFCAGLVPPELVPKTAINVTLALCGATLATCFFSSLFRGKISMGDLTNAALAGGVSIGASCDFATHNSAFIIGLIGGLISTVGYNYIQPALQERLKGIDTCGVTNLHGWPGLFGGFAAMYAVQGINRGAQLEGIIIAVILALVTGYITGRILSGFGRRRKPYNDHEETVVEGED